MRLTKLLKTGVCVLLTAAALHTTAMAGTAVTFNAIDGNAANEVGAFVNKLDTIGYSSVAKNINIQNFYYEKYKERNVELLSFYTVTNIGDMRELLLSNPDFGAYAPFNFLVYKTLDTKNDDKTWYGHMDTKLMLEIIGDKDPENAKKFTAMIEKFDALKDKELKSTSTRVLEFSKELPKVTKKKMVKTFERPDDMEEFLEDFVVEHDAAFVKHNFIIAGFIDFKFEYEDRELAFDKYDAYWVSSLCHFKFSNSVFNHGEPQAGIFAPCSIYFYIPKGKNEIHVGYASVENWIATTGIEDKKMQEYMLKIDKEVVETFKELGFVMES